MQAFLYLSLFRLSFGHASHVAAMSGLYLSIEEVVSADGEEVGDILQDGDHGNAEGLKCKERGGYHAYKQHVYRHPSFSNLP